ncbi:DUF3558 domain-containing protein [Nocardia vinacea]|uniref:DUF3558 domain-containing protein n=1 Tax=Nocardia vinacea TaxID=96468 RepID=UPI0002DA7F4D|nr:DUF3558 domain-containing protein [Nocardia vinacea]
MAHRLKLMLLAAAVLPGLAACGSSTSGSPSASSETSAAQVKLFDPCTQIADDVLTAAGVNPSAKESGVAGVHQSGWEICNWKGPKYSLGVFSSGRSMREIEQKQGNVEFQDVTIAGRQGRQFRVEGASYDLMCDVVFTASQGIIELTLINNPVLDHPAPPCGLLQQAGAAIVPSLPK